MKDHSLRAAVSAGIISEEAAFCGLQDRHIAAIAAFDPSLDVLVRFRSKDGDGRAHSTVGELVCQPDNGEQLFGGWSFDDIRDITAVAR